MPSSLRAMARPIASSNQRAPGTWCSGVGSWPCGTNRYFVGPGSASNLAGLPLPARRTLRAHTTRSVITRTPMSMAVGPIGPTYLILFRFKTNAI